LHSLCSQNLYFHVRAPSPAPASGPLSRVWLWGCVLSCFYRVSRGLGDHLASLVCPLGLYFRVNWRSRFLWGAEHGLLAPEGSLLCGLLCHFRRFSVPFQSNGVGIGMPVSLTIPVWGLALEPCHSCLGPRAGPMPGLHRRPPSLSKRIPPLTIKSCFLKFTISSELFPVPCQVCWPKTYTSVAQALFVCFFHVAYLH